MARSRSTSSARHAPIGSAWSEPSRESPAGRRANSCVLTRGNGPGLLTQPPPVRGEVRSGKAGGYMHKLPSEADIARAIGEAPIKGEERRDHTARSVRDALAERLGVDPRELGGLSAEIATRALANLNLTLERLRQLEEEAAVDELTGVYRRGHGMMILTREVRRAFRSPDERLIVA